MWLVNVALIAIIIVGAISVGVLFRKKTGEYVKFDDDTDDTYGTSVDLGNYRKSKEAKQ